MNVRAKVLQYYFWGLLLDVLITVLFTPVGNPSNSILLFATLPHAFVGIMIASRCWSKNAVSKLDRSLLVFGQTYLVGFFFVFGVIFSLFYGMFFPGK